MEKCIVHCSNGNCKHNSGSGYYGLCKHPENTNRPAYCGIDRTYTSGDGCRLREPASVPQRLKSITHPELLSGEWGSNKEGTEHD